MRSLALIPLAMACSGPAEPEGVPPEAAGEAVTVVFTSRMDGEIEPCG